MLAIPYYLIGICLSGCVSALTFMLVSKLIPYQLAEANFSSPFIGSLALVRLSYALKFIIAPWIEKVKVPFLSVRLGQKRGWAVVTQCCLLFSVAYFLIYSPSNNVYATVGLMCVITFCGAIQDIIFEIYRMERPLTQQSLAAAIACSNMGFRFGTLVSTGLLVEASVYGWDRVYQVIFLLLFIGPIVTLCGKEPLPKVGDEEQGRGCAQSNGSYWEIMGDALRGLRSSRPYYLFTILFIFCYKASDVVVVAMRDLLLLALQFTTYEIGVTQTAASLLMVAGGIVGSLLVVKLGLLRSVFVTSILQLLSPFLFLKLALVGHSMPHLIAAIVVQSFFSGLTYTVLISYIISLCSGALRVTQYVICCSICTFLSIILHSTSGLLAACLSWPCFFLLIILCGLLSVVLFVKMHYKGLFK